MNKKGAILAAWLMFHVSGNQVAAETQVAVSEQNGTSPPIISWSELEKRRPPDSFHMVYAEDKSVCKTILDALNEEGYDRRYFNSSPEIYHPLPELLLQTRLNMPRKLLGTHLFRTEEYEIPWVDKKGEPQKDYWYRFIGQGYDTLALATDINESYYANHTEPYTDFIDFRRTFFSTNIQVWSEKKQLLIPEFDYFTVYLVGYQKWGENFNAHKAYTDKIVTRIYSNGKEYAIHPGQDIFGELIEMNDNYYLISTAAYPVQNDRIWIVVSAFNYMHTYQTWAYGKNDARNVCLLQSNFILQGE
ncbi:hypothetical protein JGC56_05180 [Salmonella enterica subsp. enterica serovar Saintpaul]|nr:hypothetical protein [Salmonella enterica subsp. enterica serovar Saintpaul]